MLVSRFGTFEGLSVGDLFAGSGALGLEALSRGAASCIFVEQDRNAIDALKANIAKLGATGTEVRQGSVLSLPPARAPLDLVMMDPPYASGAGAVAVDKLSRLGWIGPATLVSVETSRTETIDVAGFDVEAQRDYGKARITLLRATPAARPD